MITVLRLVERSLENFDAGDAGIFFAYCDHLVVSDNTITNNGIGIKTFSSGAAASVNGTFTSNTITNNDWYGIFIAGSDHVISDNIVNNKATTNKGWKKVPIMWATSERAYLE